MVHWLGLYTFTAEVPGSIPGQGTEFLQATQQGKNKKTNKQKLMLSCYKANKYIKILFFSKFK